MATAPWWLPVIQFGIVAAALVSVLIVHRLDPGRVGRHLRTRFILGVPWGTLVTGLSVVAVYLFVQGGIDHWERPVTIAFRAWSYFYPLGILTSGFAHAGPGHLIGNLLGTVTFGTLAEYVWGHFPRRRGTSSFGSWRTNPYVRAFVLFPTGAAAVGLVTSLFSWGPVIGFSGVVFAFIGVGLVRYPIGTVVVLAAERVVRTLYRAFTDPITTAKLKPEISEPWWVGVSIQGHLLGLLLGVVVATLILRAREDLPESRRLWAGAVMIASSLSLWAIWWFRGGNEFVLHRGIGVVFVFLFALIVTLGVRTSTSPGEFIEGMPYRYAGVLLLVFPILVIGFVAVPLNLTTVDDPSLPGDGPGIEVRDYSVTYAEDVQNQMVSVVNISAFNETTRVNTSGVIVISEDRRIWTQTVSKSRLAFKGDASIRLGGIGWKQTVRAKRQGWSVANNDTVYTVAMKRRGDDWQHVYASPASVAEPTLAGKRVAVAPTENEFLLEIRDNETGTPLERIRMPTANESVTATGIRFVREDDKIFATYNRTRVRVAKKETYQD